VLALYVYVQMWVKYKMSSLEPRFWILFTCSFGEKSWLFL